MRRLVVVGGGVAGLAAAWSARRLAQRVPGGLEVELLEREGDVGGKVRSIAIDGWLVEAGPSGFLAGHPGLDRLIDECGLTGELLPSNAASARRFLYRAGCMREIARSPLGFARSRVLSPLGMARLIVEPLIPARLDGRDESVWSFAARRIGREAADRLILPMTLGIFAGDARQLSLAAAFPQMAALERQYGSLARALLARRGSRRQERLTSFRDGMQTLPLALSRRGGFLVRRSTDVRAISRHGTGWRLAIVGSRELIAADAIVLACEPFAAAKILCPHDAAAAADLEAIPCPALAVVTLGFGSEVNGAVPSGFGVLIARGEGYRTLGNLWESQTYAGRSPPNGVLIRALIGGAVDLDAATLSDGELLALARSELKRLYGISANPRFEHVTRWPNAIPQYVLGHLDRVARIEQRVAALAGLFLAGSGFHGVSIGDSIESGLQIGERAAQWLAGEA